MSSNDSLPQLRFEIAEVARILCISRATLYQRIRDQRARFIAPLAGECQRHIRVDAERQAALLAEARVLEAPPARSGRIDQKVKTALIGQLVGLLARFGGADRDFAQPGVTPSQRIRVTPIVYPSRAIMSTDAGRHG